MAKRQRLHPAKGGVLETAGLLGRLRARRRELIADIKRASLSSGPNRALLPKMRAELRRLDAKIQAISTGGAGPRDEFDPYDTVARRKRAAKSRSGAIQRVRSVVSGGLPSLGKRR